ncbi:hypothetical protein EB093_06645 [bacterium]|nr:hypothetical protein [bacterium]
MVAVRMATLNSWCWFMLTYPIEPVYTPRGVSSSSLIISMDLAFGAPVIDPPGKSDAKISIVDTESGRFPIISATK